ncbi:MAG: metallophosphoesterase family protein [Candidatus Eisenbacteria bacterium]|uniref:Metallophosphoesterase family protein n=1 Tax=Eiseniibacteriota bacterium TaxID=2212470 RepID=A0A7Y2H302_UNCEI|nr:metallophosphoesterase family protein [Candidatus Eisenbacteria bacterium]
MRIAFISDIHANYEALQTVLEDIETQSIDEIVSLGDIVGYGPNPNECAAVVKERCEKSVLGNHDQAALGLLSTEYFNEIAKQATQWTINNLSEDTKAYLSSLPFTEKIEDVRLNHSSPLDPEKWTYVLTLEEAKRQFAGFDERICFIGHSHVPIVLEQGAERPSAIRYPSDEPLELFPDRRYIVNVGSVGQPRDRDPRSAYVWYDTQLQTLCLRRLDYEVQTVREKIREAGLPEFLGNRLVEGM